MFEICYESDQHNLTLAHLKLSEFVKAVENLSFHAKNILLAEAGGCGKLNSILFPENIERALDAHNDIGARYRSWTDAAMKASGGIRGYRPLVRANWQAAAVLWECNKIWESNTGSIAPRWVSADTQRESRGPFEAFVSDVFGALQISVSARSDQRVLNAYLDSTV